MTEDKVRRPLQIDFINPREIRMGSPYLLCEIKLSGRTNINLENNAWQDLSLWTDDNKYLILVKWNLEKNEPGFNFVIFNIATGDNVISERIMGCLNSMEVENGKIRYNKFLYTGQKTEDGDLIGNFDEEYSLQQF
ncbi:hypothetical protein H9Q13_11600 [Pontibacter sp. JH31]|uniref:Uncharacterized protein n=1 Tax=Pontibacter aquaedesilientis TaxID=2766980 RepID=A0ABR7XHQ4_9BACT|nr:hypothetical protein [Pontibacter aquaedesilientis]MBD1397810.1 hypothetical protein [Pontibacter aquaedesilientis]